MKKNKRAHKRKRKTNSIAAAVLAVVIIAAFIIIIKNNAENSITQATGAKIYFFDNQSNGLKPEVRPFAAETNVEKVKFVLEELSIGPKNTTLQPSVPPELIKSARMTGNSVEVEVTNDYYGLDPDEEILCRAAIVYTLTDLVFVESVSFNVEGSELLKPNEQPLGKIRASDIVMVPDINPEGESHRTLTLYFASLDAAGLAVETRTIMINPNNSVARYIVQELIRGPQAGNLLPTVPPETKLLDISVTDGVCSVDLSRDFITKNMGGPGFEQLTIYSVVNSLSEQSDIKSVQFLIEGKRQEQFKNESGFNNLYEAKDIPSITGEEVLE